METKFLTDDERMIALEWYIEGKRLADIAQHFGLTWDQLLNELQPPKGN